MNVNLQLHYATKIEILRTDHVRPVDPFSVTRINVFMDGTDKPFTISIFSDAKIVPQHLATQEAS